MISKENKLKKTSFLLVTLFLFLIQILFPKKIYSQSFTINGSVSVSTIPVKNASVTFVNNNNASEQYTATTDSSGNYQLNITTSVRTGNYNVPTKFKLEQNYPNPFSTVTRIPYKLKSQSNVHVTIYDILGRVVRKFSVGAQSVGLHSIVWNGRNNLGEKTAPGIYFYRLQADGQSEVKKMVFTNGSNNIDIPLPRMSSPNVSGYQKTASVNLQGGSYTIKIDNTANTYPLVTPQQFNNVEIQSDTTLNYTVNSYYLVTIYPDSSRQIIRGFGGANIVGWNPGLNYGDMTKAELQTCFGNGQGQLGLTILRLRIPPDSTQFNINVPSAKYVEALGATVFASPWTPPAWMKSNNSTIGGTLDTNEYAAYAGHLKEFADYMASQGAPLYAISIQNEPDANVNYESCYWSPTDFLNFCKYDAQLIGTKVMMPESESFNHSFSDPTLNDSLAASHISIIAGHLYGTSPAPYPLAEEKGKEVWMTEHLIGNNSNGNLWPMSLDIGKEINDCMNSGYNAYVYWWIVRFYSLIGDGSRGTTLGQPTKRGYVMSQYSKFIRPGYFRIKCNQTPQRNVYLSAYKDSASSKVVIVALNMNSYKVYQTFSLENGNIISVSPYTTSANENVKKGNDINVTNGSFTSFLEPSTITTFVSN